MRIGHSASLPNQSAISRHGDSTNSHEPNRSQSLLVPSETDINQIESSLVAAVRPHADEISGSNAARLLEAAARLLDAHNSDAMAAMPREGQEVTLGLAEIAEHGADQASQRSQPGTAAYAVIQQAAAFVQDRQEAEGGTPLTARQRAIAVMDFVGGILNNHFEEDSWRCAANVLNVGIRTGLIVGMTTTLRQLIGFGIEKALQLGDAPMPAREAIGIAAMLIGPGLNIAGFVRDEVRHSATVQSRAARIGMFALSTGALVAASQIREPLTICSAMSSMGLQMASYTVARDLAQLFFPLNSNEPSHFLGSIVGNAVYSVTQFGVGEAMDEWAPSSGAGRVMAAAAAAARPSESAATSTKRIVDWFTSELGTTAAVATSTESIRGRVHRAVSTLQPDLAQDVMRGTLNAVAEIVDDLVRPGISRALYVRQTQAAVRREALAEGRNPEAAVAALPGQETEGLRLSVGRQWPNRTQVADQFLTTNAMRTSAFQTVLATAMSAAAALGQTKLSPAAQGHLVNAVAAATVCLVYEPFVYAHAQRKTAAVSEAEHAGITDRKPQGMEIRQRRISTPASPAS